MIRSVYLAGSYAARAQIEDAAQDWMDEGFVVLSNWLWWKPQDGGDSTIDLLDRHGIELADVVVVYHTVPSTKGGLLVELGLALGMDKQVICIGDKEDLPNAFFSNPAITHFATTYDAIADCLLHHTDRSLYVKMKDALRQGGLTHGGH